MTTTTAASRFSCRNVKTPDSHPYRDLIPEADSTMLASRKALLSNLNYVHLQHVSFGMHLSMLPDVTDAPNNQDTGVKDGCHHTWKETMVDPNSNDPSIPCQCCDQHSEQEVSLQYSSLEDLDTIIRDDCLSPDDLPLSPLSLSSPSTDSSSSSDFTLDDSPASMYYKEYSHEGLDTPDQQPDIIPLDSATEGPFCPIDSSDNPEIRNNNLEAEDTPFIDWESDSMLDSNSNTLIDRSGSSSMDSDTTAEPEGPANKTGQVETMCGDLCPSEDDLLPGLPSRDNTSNSTPKKTITSFHELALKRRKSGGQPPSQPKRDRSDWLIVFSPDTEQPPFNELTASAFYHGILEPQTNPLPAGKEVTTFRELRYRSTMNKQSSQQVKVHEEGHSMKTEATSDLLCGGEVLLPDWQPEEVPTQREVVEEGRVIQRQESGVFMSEAYRHPRGDHLLSSPVGTLPNRHKEDPDTGDWIRGMADGGDRRSREGADFELLMADESEDCEQRQKKSLLIAVGSSVEKIISHFNTSRNQVQKAQLGDSRLSPVLGYLILNHLCPSLYSLLADGLKPYQKDVIVGRRRLSPWSLVEASTKSGPENMHLLFSKVNRLTQLRDSQRKFNAFIFGLLNMKQLDAWVLHLHQIYNQLSIFYLPSGFLPLAATLQSEFRDELLLSLQPLSALTFHTDLLFEHHHLSLQDLPTPHRAHSPGHVADTWAVPTLQNILDLGGWITNNLTWNIENKAPLPNKGKPMDSPEDFRHRSEPDMSTPAGDTLIHAVHSTSDTVTRESMAADNTKSSPDQVPSREVTSNWWNHLGQASRIYIPTNRESVTFSTLKKLTSWGPTDNEQNQRASSSKATDCPPQRLTDKMATTAQSTACENDQQQLVDTEADNLGGGTGCGAGPQLMKTPTTRDSSRVQHPDNEEKATWLGQLFGAGSSHGRELEARNSKSRRPSSWLPPNVSVWSLIRKQSTSAKPEIFTHKEEESIQRDNSRPQRSLRALCDHAASGETQLSFRKGDVLQLLGTVDEDWIQCRRGNDTGLVPVGYTSLIL